MLRLDMYAFIAFFFALGQLASRFFVPIVQRLDLSFSFGFVGWSVACVIGDKV
jgi:hypothetical protein